MKLLGKAPGLALVILLALTLQATPCQAQSAGDFGVGLYQSTGFRANPAWATIAVWVAPNFMFQSGFDFSTSDTENYGFMTHAGFTLFDQHDYQFMMGAHFEIFEVGAGNQTANFVAFAPWGGLFVPVNDQFSVCLDLFPFALGHVPNNTDASFFHGRLGVNFWFN